METVLLGDAVEQLRGLSPESVNACVTSPPYYYQRDYGAEGQIGLEVTPEEYIDRLREVFREVRRVLRPDGTMWINIGDSYAKAANGISGYKPKDLIGIPWMLAFALRGDGLYLRQDIVWNKPNCMPESVRDRCTKSHEYLFLLSKSPRYYFDAAAISEAADPKYAARYKSAFNTGKKEIACNGRAERAANTPGMRTYTGRRNKRDVWTVGAGRFRGAHFAVFPEKLIEPCILAGCPPDGTVLDPFAGSGTTGVVSKRLSRNFIGIEINPTFHRMAAERIAAVTY